MQEEDLTQVADELYALPPDDFRPARDERAGRARASGDSELARAIAALRRPAVSAWLVNRLAREAPDQVAGLIALGESLRDAQRDLAGDRLRELSARRGQLTTALVNEAKRLAAQAGRPVSLQVEREVEGTLQAALADPAAAVEVSAGRLAGPLTYAGLGTGEVAAPARRAGTRDGKRAAPAEKKQHSGRTGPATGTPRRGPGTRRTAAERAADQAAQREAREAAREAAAAERREREAAEARAAVQDAAGAVAVARTDLGQAEQNAASARKRQETLRRRAEQLDRELAEALAEESRANRTFRDAQRGREAAARALDAAEKRLAKAEQAARKLTSG